MGQTNKKEVGAAEQWMSEVELEQWLQTRSAPKAGAVEGVGFKQTKKPTQTKLNNMLLDAAESGDCRAIAASLAQGADPNARIRAQVGYTALNLAINAGHEQAVVDLLSAGTFPAPSRWEKMKDQQFSKAVETGEFTDFHKEELWKKALTMFLRTCQNWCMLTQARDVSEKNLSDEALVAQSMGLERFDLAQQAQKAGVETTERAWSSYAKSLGYRHFQGIVDHPRRKSMLEMIASVPCRKNMSEDAARLLFEGAVSGQDPELALALLDAGLRPSSDWILKKHSSYGYVGGPNGEQKFPILLLAAASKTGDVFDVLKRCKPVVNAAIRFNASPWVLNEIPIGRLMEIHEMGVPLSAKDDQNRGLALVWAKLDQEPRDGWATLAKKCPELFALKDSDGKNGADLMAEKLVGKEKDDFLASLSRIEFRELRKEIAPVKAPVIEVKKTRL